jgi:predicted nucleic acid-binding protein
LCETKAGQHISAIEYVSKASACQGDCIHHAAIEDALALVAAPVPITLAAALAAGCDTLYAEDMQHGRSIGGLAIVDPFREATP